MHIAWLAEQVIFEMVMLEIGKGVRHVGFAREERLLPDHLALTLDARHAPYVGGRRSYADLRAEARRAQFRMSEEKIVDALGHMVGEFIRQSEADAEGPAAFANDIDPGDFRLLAAIEREAG